MSTVNPLSTLQPAAAPASANSFSDLGGDDFLKLLITQLTNQDPLAPTSNEDLLRQISSIRDIELSTTLTKSLQQLTGQQDFSSASSLIGQYVTGLPDLDGVVPRGLVAGVRFADGNRPVLLLSSGREIPLEQVSTIEPAIRAAEKLIGESIMGVDSRVPREPQLVEGVVTGVRTDEKGETLLELDGGADIRLRDVSEILATVE